MKRYFKHNSKNGFRDGSKYIVVDDNHETYIIHQKGYECSCVFSEKMVFNWLDKGIFVEVPESEVEVKKDEK